MRTHQVLPVIIAFGLLAPGSYAAQVDGRACLRGETCHEETKVVMDGVIDHLAKYTQPDCFFGTWTAVLPGWHDFHYSHAGFHPETRACWVNAIGTTHLPEVTLESKALCQPSAWQKYPYTIPGTDLLFPVADGIHDPVTAYPVEWWYGNFHLVGRVSGKEYAVFVAFFKLPRMILMSVIDLQTGQHYAADRYPLTFTADHGALGIACSLPPFTDRWENTTCAGDLFAFESRLQVDFLSSGVASLDLNMRALKPPMPVSGDGFIQIGPNWSYYYSQTRLDVIGTIHIPGSGLDEEEVTGQGWMDHQWGNVTTHVVSWEWMSIQLDSAKSIPGGPREIMVANGWVDGAPAGSFSEGLNDYNQCTLQVLPDYTMTTTHTWIDPVSGRTFATGWRVQENSRQIDLQVTRRFNNQVIRPGIFDFLPPFWEGFCDVTGTIGGAAVTGHAFAEVTHAQPQSVGGCCLPGDPVCLLATASECAAEGGQFPGYGTTCQACSSTGLPPVVSAGSCGLSVTPNPARSSALLAYQTAGSTAARLEIFDASGRLVRRLLSGPPPSSSGTAVWDGLREDGRRAGTGVYFCRLTAGSDVRERTLVLFE